MGTNNLSSIGASIVRAVGNQLDQYFTALTGVFVPRKADGTPEDNTQDLGSPTFRWRRLLLGNLKVEGNTISSTDTDVDINITPDGDGDIILTSVGSNKNYIFGSSATDFNSTGNFELSGVQEYHDFTINSGHVMSVGSTTECHWLILRVNGTLTIEGNIIGDGRGARGGANGEIGADGIAPGGVGGVGVDSSNAPTFVGGSIHSLSDVVFTVAPVMPGSKTKEKTIGDTGYPTGLYNKYLLNPGYGAGGGGSDNGHGGHGGAGLLVFAKNIVIVGTPTISSKGNNGATSSDGGGGGGGTLLFYYKSLTGSFPTLAIDGGSGSTHGSDGGDGYQVTEEL